MGADVAAICTLTVLPAVFTRLFTDSTFTICPLVHTAHKAYITLSVFPLMGTHKVTDKTSATAESMVTQALYTIKFSCFYS